MPKIFNREVPTWMLGLGVAALGVLLYSAFGGDDSSIKSTTATKKTASKSTNTLYTLADTSGPPFANFSETPKDAFLPAISKAGPATILGGFSSEWANGEAGWGFTGYVVFNGKAQALLENSSTGEGAYVGQGEHWKTSTIEKVTQDTLVLSTASGTHSVKIGEGSEKKGGKDAAAPPVAPADPNAALQGPIGAPGQIAQQQPGLNGIQPDMTQQAPPMQQYGGRGRRGGGRRGGGGGGGGYNGG